MELPVFLNRRSGIERRLGNQPSGPDRRRNERREFQTSPYVLVVGQGGIDRFGLLIMVAALLLIAAAIIGSMMSA
jgi:hypothetical protein